MVGGVNREATRATRRRDKALGLVEADRIHPYARCACQFCNSIFHAMTLRVITLSVEEANRCGSQENGTPAGLGNRGQEEQRENSPMVVDISAGGIRFASNIEYDNDEDVICHFELPGSLCFVLPAQIVRVPRLISCRKRQDERWRRVLWARRDEPLTTVAMGLPRTGTATSRRT
jgi:hypothetical protein